MLKPRRETKAILCSIYLLVIALYVIMINYGMKVHHDKMMDACDGMAYVDHGCLEYLSPDKQPLNVNNDDQVSSFPIVKQSNTSIPKIVHFIYGLSEDFGGKPFGLVHYLAVKSAYLRIKPTAIHFYFCYEPTGEYWDRAQKYITKLQIHELKTVYGRPVNHFAHRADVIRLRALRQYGGIYLDLDVIVLQSFDDLINGVDKGIDALIQDNNGLNGLDDKNGDASPQMIMGQEGIKGKYGLCNAIMMSAPHSFFVETWLNEYRNFNDERWGGFSVELPLKLSKKVPAKEITVLNDKAFFYPLWTPEGITTLFADDQFRFSKSQYAVHLWESKSYKLYMQNLTPKIIREKDTSFHRILRPLIQDEK